MEEWLFIIVDYAVRIGAVALFVAVYNLIRKYKLEKAVFIAVKAAEQVFKGTGLGEKKKQDVIDFITSKFKVTREELDRLIESAVFEMKRLQGK